jgi:hypothetical protein
VTSHPSHTTAAPRRTEQLRSTVVCVTPVVAVRSGTRPHRAVANAEPHADV